MKRFLGWDFKRRKATEGHFFLLVQILENSGSQAQQWAPEEGKGSCKCSFLSQVGFWNKWTLNN